MTFIAKYIIKWFKLCWPQELFPRRRTKGL